MSIQLSDLIKRVDIARIAENEGLIFEDEMRLSILEAMHSIDVQACPGSGKTTLIATKLILLSKKWPFKNQGICVLSHTNVAKDEIIGRLKKSKTIEAQRLLSYPHFVGTIQEFVNRFLALPYLRSNGVHGITIDNDEYVKAAWRLLGLRQFGWLRGTLNGLGKIESQDGFLRKTFCYVNDGKICVNMDKRPRGWRNTAGLQRAEQDFSKLKKYLGKDGFFMYRDMYTYAHIACSENKKLGSFIRERFPCVLIDEMQDTQKYQDELLSQLFSLKNQEQIVQRFGDSDQAIYHGTKGEEPNESYNSKSSTEIDYVINKSHRFDNSIAEKIRRISFNEINLETEIGIQRLEEKLKLQAAGVPFEHSILVYKDESLTEVIPEFSRIVASQFSEAHKQSEGFSVKVIGAVGKEIESENDLRIRNFWEFYDKTKSKSQFQENTFLEAVNYCRYSSDLDWAVGYKLLIICTLKLLRYAEILDSNRKNFNKRSMKEFLVCTGNWWQFMEIIHRMLNEDYLVDKRHWGFVGQTLSKIFGLDLGNEQVAEYLAFTCDMKKDKARKGKIEQEDCMLKPMHDNLIRHQDGFEIELSTIHGVKGETHDATLVLETKYFCFDLGAMIPYLSRSLPSKDRPNNRLKANPSTAKFKPNQKFMRQLYVAMSRPKHLLCLAVHTERIAAGERDALIEMGWKVVELQPVEPEAG